MKSASAIRLIATFDSVRRKHSYRYVVVASPSQSQSTCYLVIQMSGEDHHLGGVGLIDAPRESWSIADLLQLSTARNLAAPMVSVNKSCLFHYPNGGYQNPGQNLANWAISTLGMSPLYLLITLPRSQPKPI